MQEYYRRYSTFYKKKEGIIYMCICLQLITLKNTENMTMITHKEVGNGVDRGDVEVSFLISNLYVLLQYLNFVNVLPVQNKYNMKCKERK